MNILFLLFTVSFLSSLVGSICGIGGGVIIKPVLDMTGLFVASDASYLSSLTVLMMSFYSVCKNINSKEKLIDVNVSSYLAVGSIIGGILGKYIFNLIKEAVFDERIVGFYQAFSLLIITILTLIFVCKKENLKTILIKNKLLIILIGLILGMLGSFLGIGGGPINIVVLNYFFSMEAKVAAVNSLYIILFSQISGLLTLIINNKVPSFHIYVLFLMVISGLIGGIVGRKINKKIDNKKVDYLFIFMLMLIILINLYNVVKYLVVR